MPKSSVIHDRSPSEEVEPATRLIRAAGPVFAQRGFDGASVREIVKKAGVNVAAVSYYFGDKMGLYRAVITDIRRKREHQFPAPVVGDASATETLTRIIRTMLSRMLTADETGWEMLLMMREMQQPTAALDDMIQEYFKPIFDVLCVTIEQLIAEAGEPGEDASSQADLIPAWQTESMVPQIALGVVGQCLYYRIGRPVLDRLIAPDLRQRHFGLESLCQHISASTLAVCGQSNIIRHRNRLENNRCQPDKENGQHAH